MVVFVDSAFKHGYNEDDFFAVLETGPLKLRSRRGLEVVFHMRRDDASGKDQVPKTMRQIRKTKKEPSVRLPRKSAS